MVEREIPNFWSGKCFGCSRTNPHGLQLCFWLSEKGSLTKCPIPDYLCGIDELVPGGILIFLLDEVAPWTIVGRLGRFGITHEISMRLLKPVPTNTEIIVEGQITDHDEENLVIRSAIHSSIGVRLAEIESNWLLASPSAIAKISAVDELTLQEFLAKYPQTASVVASLQDNFF